MERRQQLENIIIGTLLESTKSKNYFDDCRSIVTAEMFRDEVNRKIFCLVSEMNAKGMLPTTPYDIFEVYGEKVADIIPRMCELVTDWSFVYKNWKYNEEIWLNNAYNGTTKMSADVSFADYVNRFIIVS